MKLTFLIYLKAIRSLPCPFDGIGSESNSRTSIQHIVEVVAAFHSLITHNGIIEPGEEECKSQIGEQQSRGSSNTYPDVIIIPVIVGIFLATRLIIVLLNSDNSSDPEGSKRNNHAAADYPGDDTDRLLRWVATTKCTIWSLTSRQWALVGVGVGGKANAIVCFVMNGVVVHIGRHAHYKEGLLALTEKKRAD